MWKCFLCQADAVISDSCLLDGNGTPPDLGLPSCASWGAGFVKRWGEKYSRFVEAAWRVRGAAHLLVFVAGNDVSYSRTDAEALEWGLQDHLLFFMVLCYCIVKHLCMTCSLCVFIYSWSN